jgi:hypothetical protein
VESAAVILGRYIIDIFMDTSISSNPHHNFFVEGKFYISGNLKKNGYDRIQLQMMNI